MSEKKKSKIKTVEANPLKVSPGLVNKELARPWRRLMAMIIDVIASVIVFIPIMIVVTTIVIYFRSPDVFSLATLLFQDIDETEEAEISSQIYLTSIYKINETMPDKLPLDFRNAVKDSNEVELRRLIDEYEWDVMIAFSDKPLTNFDEEKKQATIGLYPFLGKISFLFNFGGVIVFYFTLVTWITNGYTLGKWLFRIRVHRLNGKQMSLWHAFDRAGGYTASLATFGLGFIEMFWTDNRQCIHDRISGTVVLREYKEKTDSDENETITTE